MLGIRVRDHRQPPGLGPCGPPCRDRFGRFLRPVLPRMDWNLWNRGVGPVEEDAKSGAPSPVLGSCPDPPPSVLHLHHALPRWLFGNPYLVRLHRSRRRWPVMDCGACVQSLDTITEATGLEISISTATWSCARGRGSRG